ncbi:hypothetical protein CU097_010171 [Rhizopus azygosporus]|uniref:Uncharacterized protein n=1 Tax=Rhizopus azygosporus TaxID=86630 RepID=A0A367JNF3_RHIAZ|nr:hypothetical protein CU097_010171 [Rhizopus azygosporus]
MLPYPFLKAACAAISTGAPQFKSMARRSNNSEVDDEAALYNTDGIISLHGYGKLKVLLLETSKQFGSINGSKCSFDHHKGLLDSLSMLKAIAGTYSFGNMQASSKVKVFFIHAAGIKE